MAKRKRKSNTSKNLLKKTSATSLIFFLLLAFFQLAKGVESTQETKLPAANEPVALYSNQTHDNLTTLYVQAISQAKSSVTLLIYGLVDPSIIGALNKKCAEGVPVSVICDPEGSPGIVKKMPTANVLRRFGRGLMHKKILIIDNRQILLGSANLTYSSLNIHGNLVLGIENPALASAITQKAQSMDEEGGSNPMLHVKTQAANQNVELWILPDDPEAVNRMIALFRSATKSIKVAMFTWTRTDFTQELIAAQKRGVKVEAVLDRYAGKGSSAKIVAMLEKGKIPVRLSSGQGLLHHKFAYIDNKVLVSGSANWTKAAFETNDDCFVIVDPLIQTQQEKMDALWSVIWQNSEKPEKPSKS